MKLHRRAALRQNPASLNFNRSNDGTLFTEIVAYPDVHRVDNLWRSRAEMILKFFIRFYRILQLSDVAGLYLIDKSLKKKLDELVSHSTTFPVIPI